MSGKAYAVTVKILHAPVGRRAEQRSLLLPDIPPRSRLYGSTPREVGTLWTESLSSYISREALAHGVSPMVMVVEEVSSQLSRSYYFQTAQSRVAGWGRDQAMSVNGNSETAADWSETLGRLTRRSDLHTLIAYQWASGLALRDLLHKTPRWCPTCYWEWQENGLPLYQPLLWMLHIVTVCPRHMRPLEQWCPHCLKSQSTLPASRTPIGHCTQCQRWLGTEPTTEKNHDIEASLLSWQQWIVREVETLQRVSAQMQLPQWERFSANLATCAEMVGGVRPLARLALVPHRVIQVWLSHQKIPSFESTFKCCYALHVSPLQFLTANPAALKEMLHGRMQQQPVAPPKRPVYHLIDREHTLEFIQAVLDGRESALSIHQIERRLGISNGMLRYRFPQECDEILRQYQAARTKRKQERASRVCEEVRQITFLLHAQNISPSHDRVQAQLSNPNIMRQPEGRAAWHAARRELGLEQ